MRRRLLYYLFLLLPMGLLAQGWPANYGGVMLQGFYWDSYEDAKWTTLTSQADELSTYFNLIWVPNSGQTKEDRWNSPGNWGYENMGYMPVYWLKHNTCFGTQEELMQMIQTFKAKGTGFIEDVVINHKNGLTNWADFPNETVTGPTTGNTYTVTWATDMQDLWGICTDDELYDNGGVHDGVTYVSNSSAHAEEGTDNFDGCRDLDHVDKRVQQNIYTYLDYLIKELGYVGFRYDMVKGYKPYYTGLYNVHAKPQFSVGEYWDSDYNNVAGYWITETGLPANGVIQSAAFDFPLKYKINAAFNSSSWGTLSNKGVAGDPNMSRYAVTFVDNHDTYRNEARLNNNVLAANAFILAMPGTPCVFLPHWKQYKPELKKMIAARKAAGITNQSEITVQKDVDNGKGYYLKVTGEQGSVILTLGDLRNANVDLDNHTLVQSGDNFAFYLWDDVYNQNTYDAIDEESAKDIAVYVRDNGEGAPYLYVWNGGNQPNGGFPGRQFTENDKVTLADGTTWYKQTFHISSLSAIVSFKDNEGKQTADIGPFTDDVYICYYKNDDRKHADYTSLYRGDVEAPTVHAYFDAPAGWNKAYAWCTKFYDLEKKYAGEWPGQTMEKVGQSSTGNDIYRWSIEKNLNEGVPDHIIFNNGSGSKTGNLDFYNAAYYDQIGLAAESQLYFMPTVMRGASFVSGTNWDGASATLAQAGSGAAMTHTLYYPAGEYTVQAIVRGTSGSTATLTVGTPGGSTNATSSTDLTGLDGASSTVTIDGVVENAVTGTNNGWHKVQARYVLAEEGVLKLTLTSDASTWQVGAVTILKSADSQDNYHTTATWQPTETNANVVGMHHFSFYDRGVNKNALITATNEQAPSKLPCNAVVNGTCSRLALTDGAYDFSATSGFTANAISYDRTFKAGNKSTVCLPFAITAAEMAQQGIKAYEFNGLTSKGGFHFSPVEAMEANHPYVVEMETEGQPFANLEGRAVARTDNLETTADNVTFRGTMQRTLLTSGDKVYYGYSNGTFVRVGSRVGVNPFRAYIVTSSEMGSSVEAVFDESDGIHELSSVVSGATGDIYTLDGRKVAASSRGDLPKGVYICNGRKFVVK